MDILEIKTIDDVDVDGIIKELESNKDSVKSTHFGETRWSGTIQNGISASVTSSEEGLVGVSLEDRKKKELFEYSTLESLPTYYWKKVDSNHVIVYEKEIRKDGLIKETKPEFDEKGRVILATTTINGNVEGTLKIEYFGDSNKRKRMEKNSASGKLSILYVFDENGRVTLNRSSSESGVMESIKKYDDQDRCIEEAEYTDGVLTYKITTKYDTDGMDELRHIIEDGEEKVIGYKDDSMVYKKEMANGFKDFEVFRDIIPRRLITVFDYR